MNGRVQLTHNFEGETGYVIIRWYKTTSPLTAASGLVNGSTVTQVVYPASHSQESLLIEELDTVMYFVKAYRSADGVSLDEQINVLAVDAAIAARYILTQYTYVVGRGETGDPVDGDSGLRDSRLENAVYTVEERGTGKMIPPGEVGAEYTDRSDDGGGFDWVGDKTFNEGGVYFVTVQERIDLAPGGGSSGGSGTYSDVVEIPITTDYDIDDHNGKILAFTGVDETPLSFNLAALSTLADAGFKIETHTGLQRNVTLQLNTGDTAAFRGTTVNKIILGQGEWLEVRIKNNKLYVSGNTGHDRLGEETWGRNTTPPINRLVADGSLINAANYPRVAEYLDTIITVSTAAWVSDKGKWGRTGDDIRVPDLRDYFLRAVGSNPGRTQAEEIGPHVHPFFPGNGGGVTTTPGGGALIANNSNPYTASGYVLENTGTENRPKNIGLIPYICI